MDRFTTLRQRLYSILATLSILFATHVSEYAAKPDFVPGEELPQSPFSCVAEGPQVGADGLTLTAEAPLAGILRYRPPEAGTHAVTVTAADGKTFSATHDTGPDGMITVDLGERGAVSVVIA